MKNESLNLTAWLTDAAELVASDVHLVEGYPPIRRENGNLIRISDTPLTRSDIEACLKHICSAEQHELFIRERNLDFAFALDQNEQTFGHEQHQFESQRFRGNLFYSGDSPGACIRVIPNQIPELHENNFPLELAERLTSVRNGLIIFSGITGSGKTTSWTRGMRTFHVLHS